MEAYRGSSRWTKNRRLNRRVKELLGNTIDEEHLDCAVTSEGDVPGSSDSPVAVPQIVEEQSTDTPDECSNIMASTENRLRLWTMETGAKRYIVNRLLPHSMAMNTNKPSSDLSPQQAGVPMASSSSVKIPQMNRIISVYPQAPSSSGTSSVIEPSVKELVLETARMNNKLQILIDLTKQLLQAVNKTAKTNMEEHKDLKERLERLEQSSSTPKCSSTDEVRLPICSVERLLQLDKDMRKDDRFSELLRSKLRSCKCANFKETIRRNMSLLLDTKCATEVSLSGKRKQVSFRGTLLYSHLQDIVLEAATDKSATVKNLDKQLIEWFHGARDRITGRKRPRLSKPPTLTKNSYVSNSSSSDEDKENQPSCSTRS